MTLVPPPSSPPHLPHLSSSSRRWKMGQVRLLLPLPFSLSGCVDIRRRQWKAEHKFLIYICKCVIEVNMNGESEGGNGRWEGGIQSPENVSVLKKTETWEVGRGFFFSRIELSELRVKWKWIISGLSSSLLEWRRWVIVVFPMQKLCCIFVMFLFRNVFFLPLFVDI